MFEFRFGTPRMDADTGAGGGGDFGGGNFGGETAAPQAQPQQQADPYGRQGNNPLNQWAQADQNPQAPTVEELDFAGRKVPVTDPVIRELHRDYSHLQRTFQDTNQTMRTLQEQNQMFAQMLQTYQQQQAPQAQAQAEPQGPTAEDIDAMMAEWYENPKGFIQKMVQESIKPVIEPMQKERQYQEQVQGLSQKYSDFNDMVPGMQQVIEANPQWAEQQSLETIYLLARGQQPAQQVPTLDQLLQTPEYRQQLLSNEGLRNEFVSTYMRDAQQRQAQVPPVMGGGPGGNAPFAPNDKPKTVREATKGFARYLGMGG